MKKIFSVVIVYLFVASVFLFAGNLISQTAKADTTVSSDITTDTTWYAASSPYIISKNIAVSSGVTLTIEPGVTVKFSAGTKLTVAGNLDAVGTSGSLITFTSNNPSPAAGDYNTTVFTGGSTSTFIMNYCNVQYATDGVTLASPSGGIYNIQNCEISHNQNSGIFITQEDNNYSFIEYNEISYNPIGINSGAISLHGITIGQNTLQNNNHNGVYINAFASEPLNDANLNGANIYSINITGNTVTGAAQNGIYFHSSSSFNDTEIPSVIHNVNIIDNTVSGASQNNIYIYSLASMTSFGGFVPSKIYDINITANAVSGAAQNGIYLLAASFASNTHQPYTWIYNITIIGNTVTGAVQKGIYIYSAAPIVSYLFNVYIMGNTVSHNGGAGIDCAGCTVSLIDVTIISNMIFYNSYGIIIEPNNIYSGGAIRANITRNSIYNNSNVGVFFSYSTQNIYNPKDHGNYVKYNNIYSNGYGMDTSYSNNRATSNANATYNWWGDSSGPYHKTINPSGKGNRIGGTGTDLVFVPWLTAPFNSTPPNNSAPNTPGAPTGSTSVYTGVLSTYTVTATDPDGNMIKYGWDWNGDGVVDQWSGLVPSGTSDVRSHSWSSAGVYNISVIAEDQYGAQSNWSGKLQVTVQNAPVPEITPQILIVTLTIFTAIFLLVRKRRPSGSS